MIAGSVLLLDESNPCWRCSFITCVLIPYKLYVSTLYHTKIRQEVKGDRDKSDTNKLDGIRLSTAIHFPYLLKSLFYAIHPACFDNLNIKPRATNSVWLLRMKRYPL